jgi:carbonic anhydrase
MQRFIIMAGALAAISGAATLASETTHHWSYSGEGAPAHWAQLDHSYAACGDGKSQSPVDIRTHDIRKVPLPALVFDYKPTPLHLIDNGHTIQVNVDPGSSLQVGGDRYELVQFHFHHPSEERIDGKAFDMVAHLVHRDSKGRLAVVAVPLVAGSENALIAALWAHLPKQKEQVANVRGVTINPAALLPRDHSYYTYRGSLTTPPCTEGVRWLVLKSPSVESKAEIEKFTALYPNDARPTQKLNGRHVLATK